MLPEWSSVLVAKAKVAGLLAAALAAGGVGGAVALSHVAPVSQQVVTSASATSSPDPETTADPETTEAPTPDPETTDAPTPDPETTDAPAAGVCPSGVKNHGAYVSSVARTAPHGKDAEHGKAVSAAAKSDCGKDKPDTTGASDDREPSNAQPEGGTTTKPSHPSPPKSQGKAHAHQH